MQSPFSVLLIAGLLFTAVSEAQRIPTQIIGNRRNNEAMSEKRMIESVESSISFEPFREVRIQPIFQNGIFSHLLVYLFIDGEHTFEFARVEFDSQGRIQPVKRNYAPQPIDHAAQVRASFEDFLCPDTSLQFLSIVPSGNPIYLDTGREVAQAAIKANLKTKELYTIDATTENYLNYMSCPSLRGIFFDGDAVPSAITTIDGYVQASDFTSILKGKWAHQVTNIWLACFGYLEPLLSAVTSEAQSRKYAAGINKLAVGPSDKAAACAMKAAIAGQPITASFWNCYRQWDLPRDHWGISGSGTDYFWN